jgi:hypothetical protein
MDKVQSRRALGMLNWQETIIHRRPRVGLKRWQA